MMLTHRWMAVALVLLGGVAATAQPPGDYWLGIQCAPALPATGMPFPERQGLLVVTVAPESPAAKAGIVQHDILLRAGERPLMGLGDLIQAVEAVQDGKLPIELTRDGKAITVEATPEKRPENMGQNAAMVASPDDWKTMEKWFEGAWPGVETDGTRPPLRFRFIHPGVIVPREVFPPVPLPPNVSIAVSKQGDQPAKITVRRGDEKWETTEEDLGKLPADLRPHVERMLGRGPLGVVGDLPALDVPPDIGAMTPPGGSPAWEGRFERRLDEMNRRMDRLLDAIERSMGVRMEHKTPEKPAEGQ